jgi:alcohol dehydrogenase class IV
LICIPTTGGTSADVSQFCIINDTARRTKIAIISKAIVPDLALIDPVTLTTMDPYLTACTGLDALAHAVEAYVSNANAPLTDLHALEAIRLIAEYLIPSIQHPHDVEIRSKIMLASLQAGLAFSNASLGAVHAMAHSLGGFLDLPHGECNAMLLRHVVDFNFQSEPERFKNIGSALGIAFKGMNNRQAKEAILETIDQLRIKAGVTDTLGKKGLKHGDIPSLAERAVVDPCLVTNPRTAEKRDLEVIYEQAR